MLPSLGAIEQLRAGGDYAAARELATMPLAYSAATPLSLTDLLVRWCENNIAAQLMRKLQLGVPVQTNG